MKLGLSLGLFYDGGKPADRFAWVLQAGQPVGALAPPRVAERDADLPHCAPPNPAPLLFLTYDLRGMPATLLYAAGEIDLFI